MNQIRRRLDRAEKQLGVSREQNIVFEFIDESGTEQKVEMGRDEFNELLKEINGKSRGLPSVQEISENERYQQTNKSYGEEIKRRQ